MPPHLVPDGHIVDGSNAICRDAVVMVRGGFSRVTGGANPFSDPGMGLFGYTDQNGSSLRAWAVSKTKVGEWNGSSWVDRTGGVNLTGTNDNQARMALFQTTTTTRTLMTNNVDVPQLLSSGANRLAVANLNGVTKALDCTVTFQRAILANLEIGGIRAPSTLVISDANDPDTFPALNRVDLSDTNDTIVGVRALNTQSFAIYKDASVWVGTGAPNIYPFTFELRSLTAGPVSPGAIVAAYGVHLYLGQDGMVYSFDGKAATAIGLNVYRTLQAEMDFSKSARVHGFFDRTNGEVWWFYNSLHFDSGASFPSSAIMLNVRTGAFSTICRFAKRFSASTDWKTNTGTTWATLSIYTWTSVGTTFPTWDSFPAQFELHGLVISDTGRPYVYDDATTDDGDPITMTFSLPFRDFTGDGRLVRVDAIETYWKLATGARNVDVVLRTTESVADNGVSYPAQSFDMSIDQRKIATYANTNTRWASIAHTIASGQAGDAFKGTTLYLYDRGEI